MGRVVVVVAAAAVAVAVVVLLGAAAPAASAMEFGDKDVASEEALWELYERWRGQHRVARDLGEKARRFNVFKDNVRLIHEFNRRDEPYKLRLNRFGDMTADEFRRAYASSRVSHHRMFRGRGERRRPVTAKPSSMAGGHISAHDLGGRVWYGGFRT